MQVQMVKAQESRDQNPQRLHRYHYPQKLYIRWVLWCLLQHLLWKISDNILWDVVSSWHFQVKSSQINESEVKWLCTGHRESCCKGQTTLASECREDVSKDCTLGCAKACLESSPMFLDEMLVGCWKVCYSLILYENSLITSQIICVLY